MSTAKKNLEEIREKLAVTVSTNLRRLIQAMGWTQAEFADITGISGTTLSNYVAKDKPRLAPIEYLYTLPSIRAFKDADIVFSLNDLFNDGFRPNVKPITYNLRTDYIGTYLCYLYDQSKAKTDLEAQMSRKLRFGVVVLFEDFDTNRKVDYICAKARFFDPGSGRDATEFKRKLEKIFEENEDAVSYRTRNDALEKIFEETSDSYNGELSFSGKRAFITLGNNVYNDQALIVMYDHEKKADNPFIGGLGAVASVSHGAHMPTAQKIIVSRYRLDCSYEEIGKHLNMTSVEISTTPETESLTELCKKLFSDSVSALCLDENDKTAIIENRINQLVQNYVDKNICSVGCVSSAEEKTVYSLIKKYRA